MKTLNDILQGLMKRSSEIGTVHTGEKLVETVPYNTSMKILSVTVPAGTYVVISNVEWGISDPSDAIHSLRTTRATLAISRNGMGGGGGSSCSAIMTAERETEIYVEVYQVAGTNAALGFVNLQATRIK